MVIGPKRERKSNKMYLILSLDRFSSIGSGGRPTFDHEHGSEEPGPDKCKKKWKRRAKRRRLMLIKTKAALLEKLVGRSPSQSSPGTGADILRAQLVPSFLPYCCISYTEYLEARIRMA